MDGEMRVQGRLHCESLAGSGRRGLTAISPAAPPHWGAASCPGTCDHERWTIEAAVCANNTRPESISDEMGGVVGRGAGLILNALKMTLSRCSEATGDASTCQ